MKKELAEYPDVDTPWSYDNSMIMVFMYICMHGSIHSARRTSTYLI